MEIDFKNLTKSQEDVLREILKNLGTLYQMSRFRPPVSDDQLVKFAKEIAEKCTRL